MTQSFPRAEHNAMNTPHHIEEEQPHEIYSSLVASSCSTTAPSIRASTSQSTSITSPQRRRQQYPNSISNRVEGDRVDTGGADGAVGVSEVIPVDTEYPNNDAASSSQFIQFYRKSVNQSGAKRGRDVDGKTNPNGSANINKSVVPNKSRVAEKPSSHNNSNSPQQTTTKAERRRIARRQREKQIRTDKQVRVMLRTDLSEEYEQLYTGLYR